LAIRGNKIDRANEINQEMVTRYDQEERLRIKFNADTTSIESFENRIKVNYASGFHTVYDRIIYALGGTTPVGFLQKSNVEIDESKHPIFDENYETITIDEKIMHNMVGLGNTELEAIHVDGESMEPTLQDGSIVFVDRTQTNINKDGIFIASTTAGLFIKRIRQRADGMVELISDNKAYSPEVLAPDEVSIVGKVVGNIESL
jgi:hypothetical protein